VGETYFNSWFQFIVFLCLFWVHGEVEHLGNRSMQHTLFISWWTEGRERAMDIGPNILFIFMPPVICFFQVGLISWSFYHPHCSVTSWGPNIQLIKWWETFCIQIITSAWSLTSKREMEQKYQWHVTREIVCTDLIQEVN
jgi:hypothetical protein